MDYIHYPIRTPKDDNQLAPLQLQAENEKLKNELKKSKQ